MENARQIVLEFVKIFARPTRTLVARPTQISFSRDVYSEVNPTNLTALYLSGERRSLLRVFYKALLASEDESIVLKSKPLDSRFLIDTLIINSIVTQRIENRLERDLVDELPAGSALYFGKERTSFEKLYHEISEAVLRPTFSKLPRNPNSGTKKLMMVLENIKMKKANHFHNISGENHLRRPVD